MSTLRLRKITPHDEIGYFAPKTWEFWRALIVCFCLMCIIGHWLEIPYCWFMDTFFGIVADDYAVKYDPWYHPYWVYGFGAVVMTMIVEPLKEYLIMHRKTLFGAMLQSFVLVVILTMLMELIIGWFVNQPNELGEYPFWDNSQLPLNIFGQAWLVNDVVIGVVAMVYVWLVFPLVCEGFARLRPRIANGIFVFVVVGFGICCAVSYIQLILMGAIE